MLAGLQWFKAAGFEDVQIKRIGPKWYRGVRRHGLIMGCSVTGRKKRVHSLLPTAAACIILEVQRYVQVRSCSCAQGLGPSWWFL